MRTDHDSACRPLFAVDSSQQSCTITLQFEGEQISVPAGTSVAAALLLKGAGHFRTTPVKSSPRAPYCMMGICFECLVEIDGKPSRQACLTTVREGMVVRRQQGASDLSSPIAGDQNGQ